MKGLRFYYRTLSRNKVYSLISIGGFSLCLAARTAMVVAILTVSWQSW